MAWDLKLLNNQTRSSKPRLPCLLRSYRVKWWQEFNASHAYLAKVQTYFENQRQIIHHQHAESSRFLQQESIASSKLVSAKSRKECISNLKEVLSQLESEESQKESSLQGEDEGSSSQSSTDYAQSNEDDCFGILSKDSQN